ncbi:hypothetical protein ACH4ND_02600 [Streptomyces sp. NPDC017179]|uniref:hypothetical protein n=1 Tax=Streptomyces sp. NPDC017179 TaxID=3364979 RepID=UPI003798DB25
MRRTVAERELELRMIVSPEYDVPVPARLAYRAWLERTLRLVPPGSEGEQLGLDDELAGLLAQ